jgi:hypothetical protein
VININKWYYSLKDDVSQTYDIQTDIITFIRKGKIKKVFVENIEQNTNKLEKSFLLFYYNKYDLETKEGLLKRVCDLEKNQQAMHSMFCSSAMNLLERNFDKKINKKKESE